MKSIQLLIACAMLVIASGCATPRSVSDIAATTLRGTWHGVLTPLNAPGLFAVVDRIGEGANLEEYRYDAPWRVVRTGAA